MFRRTVRPILALGLVLSASLMVGASAWAESRGVSEEGESPKAVALASDLQRKESELERVTGRLATVGTELEESQVRVDQARARQKELGRRARRLGAELKAQKEAAESSRSRLENQIQVAYRGGEMEGFLLLIRGFFGEDARGSGSTALQATRLLTESGRSIEHYKDAKQELRSTLEQVNQSKAEYRSAGDRGRALVEELEGRESDLQASVEGLGFQRDRMEERLARLEAEKEAGRLERPPATRMDARGDRRKDLEVGSREREEEQAAEREEEEAAKQEQEEARKRELEIAREEIVTRPVEPIPYEEYVRLYKESAERYGFAGDWYVLAAVGKIESNHGENMGLSNAGAMGPMQFLPSTWKSYGVDGDGDGEANIMDPEDAIPAAAAYLRAGGAPDDWYAALFTYNRAGWYVEEVLAIAESYRRIHGDDSVGPYLEPADVPDVEASPRSGPAPRSVEVPDEEKPREERPPEESTTPSPERKHQPVDEGTDAGEETVPEQEVSPSAKDETTEQYQYQGLSRQVSG